MTPAVQQAHEIVACALRPEGSLAHLAALVGFVLLAWRLSPPRPQRTRR
ncbi:MAG: hypothetical protein U0900_19465 [Myxococcota bacterium]